MSLVLFFLFFFFNDTATTEIYTLSLHDALPISISSMSFFGSASRLRLMFSTSTVASSTRMPTARASPPSVMIRSEEHTSELQSRLHLVCRLLLEKKKKQRTAPSPLIKLFTDYHT